MFTFLIPPQGKERMEEEGMEQEKYIYHHKRCHHASSALLYTLQCACIVPFNVERWCPSSHTPTQGKVQEELFKFFVGKSFHPTSLEPRL